MYRMFLEPNKEFYIDTIFYDLPYVQSDIFDAKIRNLLLFCFFEICLFTFTDFRTRSLLSFAHAFEKYEHVIGWVWKVNKSHPIRFSETTPKSSWTRLSLSQKTKNKKFATNPEEIFTCELWYVRNLQTTSDRTSTYRVSRLRSTNSRTEAALKNENSLIFYNVCRFFSQGKWIIWFYFPL